MSFFTSSGKYDGVNQGALNQSDISPHHIKELNRKLSETVLPANPCIPSSRIAAEQEEILRQSSTQAQQSSLIYNPQQGMQPGVQPNISSLPSQTRELFYPVASKELSNQFPQGHIYSQDHQDQLQQNSPQVSGDQLHQGQQQKKITPAAEDVAPSLKLSSMSSEIANASLDVQYGDSLAIRLQRVVDQLAAKKEQLRQEGVEDPHSLSIQLLSQKMDDIKQQWLAQHSDSHTSKSQQQTNNSPGSFLDEEYFPKPDQKKLLEMFAFDQSNFPSNSNKEQSEPGPAVFQCDPRKLAYMQQFDASSFTQEFGTKNPPVASIVNKNQQNPSYNLPYHPPIGLANNFMPNYFAAMSYPAPYSVNQAFSQNPTASMTANGANAYFMACNNMDGQNNTPNYQNVGALPPQAPAGMGGNFSDHLTSTNYSHIVHHDSQRISEKQQKKTDLDDLMAEIMSEDSLLEGE